MRIRKANPQDAGSIADLHARSWKTAYRGMLKDEYLDGNIQSDREAIWAERLAHPKANQYVVLVESNDRPSGFACAFGSHDSQWGTLLENLHVDPACKRSGIGSSLVQDVARWSLRFHTHASMHLWVLRPNTGAQAFYKSSGAKEVGCGVWSAPDGSDIPQLRYAWPTLHPFAALNASTVKRLA